MIEQYLNLAMLGRVALVLLALTGAASVGWELPRLLCDLVRSWFDDAVYWHRERSYDRLREEAKHGDSDG